MTNDQEFQRKVDESFLFFHRKESAIMNEFIKEVMYKDRVKDKEEAIVCQRISFMHNFQDLNSKEDYYEI
jgi:hypothetical protein